MILSPVEVGDMPPTSLAHHALNAHYRNTETLYTNVTLKLVLKLPRTARGDFIHRTVVASLGESEASKSDT